MIIERPPRIWKATAFTVDLSGQGHLPLTQRGRQRHDLERRPRLNDRTDQSIPGLFLFERGKVSRIERRERRHSQDPATRRLHDQRRCADGAERLHHTHQLFLDNVLNPQIEGQDDARSRGRLNLLRPKGPQLISPLVTLGNQPSVDPGQLLVEGQFDAGAAHGQDRFPKRTVAINVGYQPEDRSRPGSVGIVTHLSGLGINATGSQISKEYLFVLGKVGFALGQIQIGHRFADLEPRIVG